MHRRRTARWLTLAILAATLRPASALCLPSWPEDDARYGPVVTALAAGAPTNAERERAAAIGRDVRAALRAFAANPDVVEREYQSANPTRAGDLFVITRAGVRAWPRVPFDVAQPTALLFRMSADGRRTFVGAQYTVGESDAGGAELEDIIPPSTTNWFHIAYRCALPVSYTWTTVIIPGAAGPFVSPTPTPATLGLWDDPIPGRMPGAP